MTVIFESRIKKDFMSRGENIVESDTPDVNS